LFKKRIFTKYPPPQKFEERRDDFKKALLFFLGKIKKGEHFAFSRWGDGEMAILKGRKIDIIEKEHGEFRYTPGDEADENLRKILCKAFRHRNKDYYVGIGCPCCVGVESFRLMRENSGQDREHLTWANVFVNANYDFFVEGFIKGIFKDKNVVLVCNQKSRIELLPFKPVAVYRIGKNSWRENYSLCEEIRRWIKNGRIKNHVFLFCAGPLSNILTYELFINEKENTYIDAGSILDPYLGLGYTRDYLRRGLTRKKICSFNDEILGLNVFLCFGPAYGRKEMLKHTVKNNLMYFPESKVGIATNDIRVKSAKFKVRAEVRVEKSFKNLGHQISCINAVISAIKMVLREKKGDVIVFMHEDCLINDPVLLYKAIEKIRKGFEIIVRNWITGNYRDKHYGYDSYYVFDTFIIDYKAAERIFGNLEIFKREDEFKYRFAEEFFTKMIKENIPENKIYKIDYHHSTWRDNELGFYHIPSKMEPAGWEWDKKNYNKLYR